MITASWLTVTPLRPLGVAPAPTVSTAEAEPAAHAFSEHLQRAGRPAEGQPTRSGASQGAATAAGPSRKPAAASADATGPAARIPASRAGGQGVVGAEPVRALAPADAAGLLAAAAEAQAADDARAALASADAGGIEPAAQDSPGDPVPTPDGATPATAAAWASDAPAGMGIPAALPVDFRAAGPPPPPTGGTTPNPARESLAGVGHGRAASTQALREASAYDDVALGPATARPVPVAPTNTGAAAPLDAFERLVTPSGLATDPTPEASPARNADARSTATPGSDSAPAQEGPAQPAATAAVTAAATATLTDAIAAAAAPSSHQAASTPASTSASASADATAAWAGRSATVDHQTSAGAARSAERVSRADGPTDRTDGPSELAGGTGSDGPGSWTGTDAPAALTASNVVFTLDVRRGDPVATHRLDASPGSVGFGAELGTQITTFIRDGVHHARLELNPGEMGPVTVQIQLDGKAAQVHLAADNADTRRALEQSMPQLATTLREAGLTLSGGGVFEQPRSPQQERAANPSSNPGRSPGAESGTAALDSAAVTPVSARRRGVVDLVA